MSPTLELVCCKTETKLAFRKYMHSRFSLHHQYESTISITSFCTSSSHQNFCPVSIPPPTLYTFTMFYGACIVGDWEWFRQYKHAFHWGEWGLVSGHVNRATHMLHAPVQKDDSTEWIICSSKCRPQNVSNPSNIAKWLHSFCI